jgi:nucleoredoxin
MSSFSNEVNGWFGETLMVNGVSTDASEVLTDDIEVLGMYFSAHWCPPCRRFTPTLSENYTKLKDAGKKTVFVFLSSDQDQEAFDEYHKSMSFPALPFSESEIKEKFSAKYGVRGIPSFILINAKNGELITKDGRSIMSDTDFLTKFPSIDGGATIEEEIEEDVFSKPVSEWFGDKLLVKGAATKSSEILNDIEVLGIYFSAHWCPPCRGFTPKLSENYTALKEAGKKIEIVFCSSDRDDAAFLEYHNEMTFPALPYNKRDLKNELSKKYGVSGIPSLIFIDAKNGETITKEGRGGISHANFIENFPYHPKPVNDISETLSNLQDEPSLIVFSDYVDENESKLIKADLEVLAKDAKTNDTITIKNYFTADGSGGPINPIKKMMKMQTWPAPYTNGTLVEGEVSDRCYCDGCGKGGADFGKRYQDAANDYDLCLECYEKLSLPIPEDIKAPIMAILDLNDEARGGYYLPTEDMKVVNMDNMQKFIAAYKDKTLERQQA